MKKIHLLIASGAVLSTFMINSCQQPAADPATVDAKVTEAYNTQKMAVENEAATACDEMINAKVKMVQDSMATMSAKEQAALLAKTQKELAAAQKKAKVVADAKKKADAVKKKPVVKQTEPAKPVFDSKGNQVGTPTTRGNAEGDKNIKLDDKGNQQGTPTTR